MACSNRVGTEAPWNIGRFYGSSYFVDPRGNFLATGSEDKDELVVAEMDLDMIEEVRRVWQFYRDRRPDTYGPMAEQRAMSLLIKNGTIVTASDHVPGRRPRRGREDLDDRHVARRCRPTGSIDATGKYVFPGGIDVHTHLDMPFGGTTSADDFESGTIAAAHGGTTTIVDFAIQYRGQTLHHAWETWMKKAEGKAAIDYGFHMIITELTDQVELEMDALVRQGVTSFKLFMAYPGVFMLDDASIFRALLRTGKNGGTICMHAENGGVIDVLVKQALAEGKTAPKYHALTRPARAEAEATHRAIALAEIADVPIYIVHLSAAEALEMVTEARDRGLPAYAETCPQYLFLSYDNYEEPGFDGAKYVMSPPLRPKETQDRLWRGLAFNDLQAISTDHCPFCMKEQKKLGEGRLLEDPERRARHRDAHEPGVRRRRAHRADLAQPLRRADVDVAGEDLRPVPAEGHDRPRLRRRHRHLRSGRRRRGSRREDAAHEGGLQPVRRARGHRRDRDRHLARPGRHRRREVRRPRGRRLVPAPQSTVVRRLAPSRRRALLVGSLVAVLVAPAALRSRAAQAESGAAPGRWFKGNTHTHTVNSDGDSTPDEVVRWYREHGYNFLVLSDHNYLTPTTGLNAVHGAPDNSSSFPAKKSR